jgi:predicted nucleotidyltransferase
MSMPATSTIPPSTPAAHRALLARALPLLAEDARIVGVAAAGSLASGTTDEFSDLDLVVAVEPTELAAVTSERRQIASTLGPLVAAFTGEHVGEPRLLICLYDEQIEFGPLHVDLKFIAVSDLAERVDDPIILWERDGRLSQVLSNSVAQYPAPDLMWIEERFWVWIHYGALKVGRGELFEAMDFLAFLRSRVLGPLVLLEAGAQPSGVRRLETAAPMRIDALQETVAAYNAASCAEALIASARLYRDLRQSLGTPGFVVNHDAERVAMRYLDEIQRRTTSTLR